MSTDRVNLGLHYDWRDSKLNGQLMSYSSIFSMVQFCQNIIFFYFQSSGVVVLEPSRSIHCFLRFSSEPVASPNDSIFTVY